MRSSPRVHKPPMESSRHPSSCCPPSVGCSFQQSANGKSNHRKPKPHMTKQALESKCCNCSTVDGKRFERLEVFPVGEKGGCWGERYKFADFGVPNECWGGAKNSVNYSKNCSLGENYKESSCCKKCVLPAREPNFVVFVVEGGGPKTCYV